MPTCYRHPTRETGVACSNCGRPICPDCMTSTSVGMRCPECARERTRVHRVSPYPSAPEATRVLVGVNVVAYLAELATSGGFGHVSGTVFQHGALYGPLISANHEYWRLITGGFLHASFLHIVLNMYFVWIIGSMLEPAIGSARFVGLYFVALLGGSFGALLLTPHTATVGASGAAFGLLAALMVEARSRGIDLWRSGLMLTALFNFVFTFTAAGISIGGHVGGFAAGLLVGVIFDQLDRRRQPRWMSLAACAVLALVAIVGGIAAAGQ
jgi:membrane associated rhomboid family serine protease